MIRVLHVISRLPVGGVENQLLSVLRHYDPSKVRPVVCSLSDKGEVGAGIEERGIEMICLHKLGHRFDVSIISDIMKIISDRGITVVRSHQYHANMYGRIAALRARVPCIVASVHNLYTRDRKLHRRLINHVLGRMSDRVVAVSEPVRSDVIKYDLLPAEKVVTISNGINPELFSSTDGTEARKRLSISPDDVVIGSVGRLVEQKGHRYLIDAVSGLGRGHKIRVLVVGDGPDRDRLLSLAASLGLKDRVIFTGMRKDIPELLSAMDIFAFPSLWEGMPNALIEAMAAGRPVVASDILPNREVIDDNRDGLLVPVRDSAALAAALDRLVGAPGFRLSLGSAAQQKARSRFSIQATVEQYTGLFMDILRTKGVTP